LPLLTSQSAIKSNCSSVNPLLNSLLNSSLIFSTVVSVIKLTSLFLGFIFLGLEYL